MREILGKERLYLFSPYAVSVTRVEIEGVVLINILEDAIVKAVRKNELLNARVTFSEDGEAYYETQVFDSNPNEIVRVYKDVYWKDLVKEQEKVAFDLDHGELVRFFFLQNDDKQEFVIIAHRLLGDGVSIAFLIEDIMFGITNKQIIAKPYKKPRLSKTENKLSFMQKLKVKRVQKNWQQEGASFSQEEYYKLYEDFWQENESYIQYETLYTDALLKIAAFAKREGVTIGAVILTAFERASKELRHMRIKESLDEKKRIAAEQVDMEQLQKEMSPETIHVESSLHGSYKGIGDYGGKRIFPYLYQEEHSFAENVRMLDNILKNQEFFDEEAVISKFPGGMVDSIHFQLAGKYMSPDTEWLMHELGYFSQGAGLAVSNLAKVPIATEYGCMKLKNYVYMPPIHPGTRRTLGITIFGNVLNICLHVKKDDYLTNARLFFQKGIAYLREL